MIIAVSGSVCSGKTSLAKALAVELGYLYIDVKLLIDRLKIYDGYDKKRQCKVVDIRKLNNILERIIDKNRWADMIIDSHLSHHLSKDLVDICIVTKCDLKKLKNRLENRGYKKAKVKENLDCEIFEICSNEAFEAGHRLNVVDTSNHIDVKKLARDLRLKKFKIKKDIIMLKGKNIFLRNLKSEDKKDLLRNANDKSIAKFTTVPYPYTQKICEQYIGKSIQNIVLGYSLELAIVRSDEVIGMMSMYHINDKDEMLEIGYWISKKFRKKGYSKEAAVLLLRYCLKNFGQKKIKAVVDQGNEASKALLSSLGFRKVTSNRSKDNKIKDHFILYQINKVII